MKQTLFGIKNLLLWITVLCSIVAKIGIYSTSTEYDLTPASTTDLVRAELQLSEQDQDQYKDFNTVVSERWQQEVTETVFDTINQDADHRRRRYTEEDGDTGQCDS